MPTITAGSQMALKKALSLIWRCGVSLVLESNIPGGWKPYVHDNVCLSRSDHTFDGAPHASRLPSPSRRPCAARTVSTQAPGETPPVPESVPRVDEGVVALVNAAGTLDRFDLLRDLDAILTAAVTDGDAALASAVRCEANVFSIFKDLDMLNRYGETLNDCVFPNGVPYLRERAAATGNARAKARYLHAIALLTNRDDDKNAAVDAAIVALRQCIGEFSYLRVDVLPVGGCPVLDPKVHAATVVGAAVVQLGRVISGTGHARVRLYSTARIIAVVLEAALGKRACVAADFEVQKAHVPGLERGIAAGYVHERVACCKTALRNLSDIRSTSYLWRIRWATRGRVVHRPDDTSCVRLHRLRGSSPFGLRNRDILK